MSAPTQSLRPSPVQDSHQDDDRVLGVILGRLAALEREVQELRADRHIDLPDPVAVKLAQLETACDERGVVVSADGFIRESAAAQLVGRAAVTLRNWRYCSEPLPYRRFAGRIEYRLDHLARFLVDQDC